MSSATIITIFAPKIILSMEKKEKEITVIHLELDGKHYYFGSLKVLTDTFGKDVLGIGYGSLRNVRLSPNNPYTNSRCIIRKGKLIQGKRIKEED